jgi:flagellar biosynthesis/type III secretory pathway protein FliH
MLIRRHDAAMHPLLPFALLPAQSTRIRGEDQDAAERKSGAEPDAAHAAERAELHSRIDALEEALLAREAAVEAALEQGREDGRRAADELGAERLEALRDALAEASQDCLARLHGTGELAIEIARAAIYKILGEASPRAALVGEIVRNALAQVAGGAVVSARVSARDFASDEDLAALARELDAVHIVRDDALPSGGCKLELTRGTIDASLDVQLASLDRKLDRLDGGAR